MQIGVSIIICFYNAENKLPQTLEHIKNQEMRTSENTELILVNNCSTDNSEAIAREVLKNFGVFPWTLVHENEPGLANARLCGLKKAKYDILLFCDDDNWLSSDYATLGEDFLRVNPDVAVLGGKASAVCSLDIPEWFESVQNYYAVGPQQKESGRVFGNRNMVYGAGMLIRTEVFFHLLNCGFRFQSMGRTQKKLSSGEDSELCLAVQISGKLIWYLEDLNLKHFIEPRRLSEDYLAQLKYGIESSTFYSRFYRDFLFGYVPNVSSLFWLKESIYTFKDLIKNLIKFNFNIRRHRSLLVLLLTERGKYNNKVREILTTCNNLSRYKTLELRGLKG
jgi:glycosyltransferase involved in cell wall biosynthesis